MTAPAATKILTLSTGNFDQVNTFSVEVGRGRVSTASLQRDYEKRGDGIYWAMSAGASLKASYSDADTAERDRLASEAPLKHGDVVLIDGEPYSTRVLGAYSNCAVFDKIASQAHDAERQYQHTPATCPICKGNPLPALRIGRHTCNICGNTSPTYN